MCSTDQVASNLVAIEKGMQEAARRGVDLLCLPENAMAMGATGVLAWAQQAPEFLHSLQTWAHRYGLWLLAGTLPWPTRPDGQACAAGRVRAASFLIDSEGQIQARYDKMHLFDVDVVDAVGAYRESDRIEAGERPVVAETPWGRLGLSVCYDLRFAELYSQLARADVRLIAVPAAFTQRTGEAHWHVLLRARAIESQVFVLAPAQAGWHDRERQTYGHSLIVDPWGEVVLDAAEQVGLHVMAIDLDAVDARRRAMPMAQQRRL